MDKNKLNSHWENPNGPRALMKKVYYKKDVDKLLERSLFFDSWDGAWEVQRAIFDRIKVHCRWAKTDKYLNNVESFKEQVEEVKRLFSYWKCLGQIRENICYVETIARYGGLKKC